MGATGNQGSTALRGQVAPATGHFEDLVNNRNAAVIHTNMTSDFCDHDGPGGQPTGGQHDERMMLNMYKAMLDLHLTIDDMIAKGARIT